MGVTVMGVTVMGVTVMEAKGPQEIVKMSLSRGRFPGQAAMVRIHDGRAAKWTMPKFPNSSGLQGS